MLGAGAVRTTHSEKGWTLGASLLGLGSIRDGRSNRAVMNLETVRGVYLWDNRLWVNLSCDDFLWDHLLWVILLWDNLLWDHLLWDTLLWDNVLWDNVLWDNLLWDTLPWDKLLQDNRPDL